MKKTMLAICFMAMALTTAANELQNTNSEKTADVKVTATVVQPLKIETKEVKFGKVAQNSKENTPIDAGYIKIEGQANERVIVQFADGIKEEWKSDIKQVRVNLKSGNEPIMLTYSPELKPELSQPLALNDTEKKMDLIGKLDVPKDATPGDYEGTLKVKVRYE